MSTADLPDSPMRARLEVMNELVEGILSGRLVEVEREWVVINGELMLRLTMEIN